MKQADLAEANYLSLRARVAPGQRLIIPRAPTTLLAATIDNPAPETEMAVSRPVVSGNASLSTAPVSSIPSDSRLSRQARHTLSSIAKVYNTSVAALKSWNPRAIRGARISIGDRLTIFPDTAAN